MKKILRFFLFFLVFLLIPIKMHANENVNIYLFYTKSCPHCHDEIEYLNDIKKQYNLSIHLYEINNVEDKNKLIKVSEYLEVTVYGVPFTVVNNNVITGFDKNVTPFTIEYNIKDMINTPKADKVGELLGVVNKTENKLVVDKKNKQTQVSIPIIGKIELKNFSLPIVAIILGILDGFNPCAMWILLFLISILIGMKDRKKALALGIIFLITSGFVYLLFMLAWLNFAKMLTSIILVRLLIAIVALIGGIININEFLKSDDDGCDIVSDKKRKKIIVKLKKFTSEKSFLLAVLGIMVLAASVNLIELACSAGLPIIFTQLLAMNNLTLIQYIIYIGIYILFFMLDDIIVFILAMKTLELTGISTKFSKYSHLIGGILMFIIGVLMLVKPEWLMFNFN